MFPFDSRNRRRRDDRSAERARVLDVRLRADGARSGGGRWWPRIVALLIGSAGIAFLFYRTHLFVRQDWLGHSPVFAIKNFPIETDGVLSREEIELTVRVRRGQNLLLLDLPTLRERLRQHPRIEDAIVERDFPDTLKLNIRERLPIARMSLSIRGGSLVSYLLDEGGHAMPPLERSKASPESIAAESALPLILNPPPSAMAAGARGSMGSEIQSGLRLLVAFDQSELAAVTEILSVDLGALGVLQAFTPHCGTVTFRPTDFTSQLQDWQRIWNEGIRRGRAIAELDLAVGRNIPLRWQESPSPQVPPAQKSPKPKRIRRNHV